MAAESATVRLGFWRRGGATVLAQRYAAYPLAVQRPLYVDPHLPGVPSVYLLTPGAGVLAGDGLRIEVSVGPAAHAYLGSFGATRLHPGSARQTVRLRLAPGAVLEWMPDPLLPFAGTRFRQDVRVAAGAGALLLAGEVLLAGREAAGERLAFEALDLSWRLDAPPVRERQRLSPRRQDLDGPAAFGDHAALGTFRAVGGRVAAGDMVAAVRRALEAHRSVVGGATELPGSAGAVARVLGPSGQAVAAALHGAWDAARRLCLGVAAPAPRRWG